MCCGQKLQEEYDCRAEEYDYRSERKVIGVTVRSSDLAVFFYSKLRHPRSTLRALTKYELFISGYH